MILLVKTNPRVYLDFLLDLINRIQNKVLFVAICLIVLYRKTGSFRFKDFEYWLRIPIARIHDFIQIDVS